MVHTTAKAMQSVGKSTHYTPHITLSTHTFNTYSNSHRINKCNMVKIKHYYPTTTHFLTRCTLVLCHCNVYYFYTVSQKNGARTFCLIALTKIEHCEYNLA